MSPAPLASRGPTLASVAPARASRKGLPVYAWIVGGAIVAIAAVGLFRGGGLGLPPVPTGVNAEQSGLADLENMRARAAVLDAARSGGAVAANTAPTGTTEASGAESPASGDASLARAADGLARIHGGDAEGGFAGLREAFESAPRDLVIGNAYRMSALDLKRRFMADAARGATETERVPAWLAGEPLATIERLHRAGAPREVTLQYALAWADEILLFQALEIRAPANVESVRLLTELLQREPGYVPARFGRALGYLHRPARLVWPEARRAPADAASQDLGVAVAIGTKVGGGSPRLRGRLALTLGDAYAKEGRFEKARSWWQIAENAGGDPAIRAAVRTRFAWNDAELPSRLEDQLDLRLLDFDEPLTDLAVMWR